MALAPLNERGSINAISIVLYSILFFGLCVRFRRNGLFSTPAYLYVLLFLVVKVLGAALYVYVQTTLDMELYTTAAIIGTVVLSPLMLSISYLLTPDPVVVHHFRSAKARAAPNILRSISIIIFAALTIGIAGGLKLFTVKDKTPDGIMLGQALFRTAAGLAILSWILIYLAIVFSWSERYVIGTAYPIIAFMIMPVFLVRLLYGCAVAATFDTSRTQVFNPISGSWVVYMFMAFLPEIFISGSLVGIGLLTSDMEK